MNQPPILQPRQSFPIWPAVIAVAMAIFISTIVIGYFVARSYHSLTTTATTENNSTATTSSGVISVHHSGVTVTINGSNVTTTGDGEMITGSGNVRSEARNVTGFTAIEVSDAAEVEAAIGPTTSVTVTTDDNLLPVIDTKLVGQTLRISSNQSYSTKIGVKVRITAPVLVAVALAGSGSARISGLANAQFSARLAGSGSARLEGSANAVNFQLVGSGGVNARDLTAKSVQVAVAGSGSAEVCATESLAASVAGSGSVAYVGHPAAVSKSITGSGAINSR